MKIVLDENVSQGLATSLEALGHAVVAVSKTASRSMTDQEVFELALRENALLITRDYHFTNSIRFSPSRPHGILYIRHGNYTSAQEIELVTNLIQSKSADFFAKRLVTMYRGGLTIRE